MTTALSAARLAELRKVAEAATQETLVVRQDPVELRTSAVAYQFEYEPGELSFAWFARELSREDAEFVAAFCPPTALALLDEVERLRDAERSLKRDLDDMQSLRDKANAAGDSWMNRADSLAARLAAQTAQNEAMRAAMGEEWKYVNPNAHLNLPNPGIYECRECKASVSDYDNLVWPKHDPDCTRGAFFAALAALQGQATEER